MTELVIFVCLYLHMHVVSYPAGGEDADMYTSKPNPNWYWSFHVHINIEISIR